MKSRIISLQELQKYQDTYLKAFGSKVPLDVLARGQIRVWEDKQGIFRAGFMINASDQLRTIELLGDSLSKSMMSKYNCQITDFVEIACMFFDKKFSVLRRTLVFYCAIFGCLKTRKKKIICITFHETLKQNQSLMINRILFEGLTENGLHCWILSTDNSPFLLIRSIEAASRYLFKNLKKSHLHKQKQKSP